MPPRKFMKKKTFLRRILAGFQVLIQHEIPSIYLQNMHQKVISATWTLTRSSYKCNLNAYEIETLCTVHARTTATLYWWGFLQYSYTDATIKNVVEITWAWGMKLICKQEPWAQTAKISRYLLLWTISKLLWSGLFPCEVSLSPFRYIFLAECPFLTITYEVPANRAISSSASKNWCSSSIFQLLNNLNSVSLSVA